jgi:hypothetical protein
MKVDTSIFYIINETYVEAQGVAHYAPPLAAAIIDRGRIGASVNVTCQDVRPIAAVF